MILGAVATGAARLAGKLFGGIKRRRERKKIRQQKRELKQQKKINETQADILKNLGIGDATNIPDAPGSDIVAQAGNALRERLGIGDFEEKEVVTVANSGDVSPIPKMSPIMWLGVGVVFLALFGKKLFKLFK